MLKFHLGAFLAILPFVFAFKYAGKIIMKLTLPLPQVSDKVLVSIGKFAISAILCLLGSIIFTVVIAALNETKLVNVPSFKLLFEALFLFVLLANSVQKVFVGKYAMSSAFALLTAVAGSAFFGPGFLLLK